ncbi:MAG: hypothetical protein E7623_03110 [Ruminococcaceae bacterium]|nr:hypothetical protein [Oscillospiraceae bacterium]
MYEKQNKEKNLDDFWDLNDIIPKQRSKTSFSANYDTEAITVSSIYPHDKKKYISSEKISKQESYAVRNESYTYTPKNALINKVTISDWPKKYYFYEKFRADAQKYFLYEREECAETSFFSYIPQYSDMNSQQFSYYLWWRKNVRKENYLNASYSYILLYIYEILNLPDRIQPEDALNSLCNIWMHYRKSYPHLDRYLSEWICDFCLINKLDAPTAAIGSVLNDILKFSTLKEFYTDTDDNNMPAATACIFCSNYEWTKCKDITEENYSYYELHIKNAVHAFLEAIKEKGESLGTVKTVTSVIRDAYSGSLCAYDIKKQISIEYMSFSRSGAFRQTITDIIKYTINAVRGSLGVRNRFGVKSLSEETKGILEQYFASARANGLMYTRKKAQSNVQEETNNYEAYYEPQVTEFSTELARKVESSAWEMTDILVHDYEMPFEEDIKADTASEKSNIIKQGLSLVICGNLSAFNALAKANNMLSDALIEKINEAAYERIGDVVVDNSEEGYLIVKDYMEEINEWMNE